jgi:glycosyltransferase involved in cell wall biosynthesis
MGFDIAVVVSTFERPEHLTKCLESLEHQRDVEGRFEVVVTDDGSRDDTLDRLAAFADRASFPLRFTTHDHDGFRLARCRNMGIATTTADYILLTDGDCVLPPDHLRIHLEERRPGRVAAGDCLRLHREASATVTADTIRRGDVLRLVSAAERSRMRGKALRATAYQMLRLPMRPRLSGNNIAAWRYDLERINGFDERFVGWGLEDRDLQRRLERVGVRPRSVLHRTAPIHLWHEPAVSFARNSAGTANLDYFRRAEWTAFCAEGLVKATDQPVTIPLRPRGAAAARRAA